MNPTAALAAAGATSLLVGRPGRPIAHVYVGPLTPSGRFAAAGGRTVCRARTRRLTVLSGCESTPHRVGGSRRVCARCSVCLGSTPGQAEHTPRSRDGWLAVYGSLTVAQLTAAAAMVSTVAESHRVGYLAQLLHPQARDLHALINSDRQRLAAAERTPEEAADVVTKRDAELEREQAIYQARRGDVRAARLRERELNGEYVAPWERPKAG